MSSTATPLQQAPFRPVRLGPQAVDIATRPDGSLLLRSPEPLGPYPKKLTERLEYWAQHAPDRVFMAQRNGESWRTITYAQALDHARRAQALAVERREIIRGLIDEGFSQADIAREMGVTRQAVQKMLAV